MESTNSVLETVPNDHRQDSWVANSNVMVKYYRLKYVPIIG